MDFRLHHIIMFMAAGALLASCRSDAPDDVADGSEIMFETSDMTRAAATVSGNITERPFIVFGEKRFIGQSSTSDWLAVFNREPVSFDKSKNLWTYTSTQHWFPGHEHYFIAMHPADACAVEFSNSTLSFTYTVPDNFADASDILVATHRRMYSELASSVRLGFFHILSRVDFQVKNNKAADILKVTQIKLTGINKTGSFAITPAPLLPGSTQTDDYISSWSGISNKGDMTANLTVEIPENQTGSLFPDSNALFMVPQPDNKEVMMEITYEQWDDGAKFEEHTVTASVPIGGWESGKKYTYSLTISEVTKDIYLTVSVKDWQGLKNNAGIPVPEY